MDSDWQKLTAKDRTEIETTRGLKAATALDTQSPETILGALESCSLDQWGDRIAALPGRFAAARQDAVLKLQPKAVQVELPHRLLTNEAEVKAWVTEVENLLLEKVAKNPISL
jgi:hypothetical protein